MSTQKLCSNFKSKNIYTFQYKKIFCFSLLAIIICFISWSLLKVIISYREKDVKNDPLQVSKTLDTCHWEKTWHWQRETEDITCSRPRDVGG